jgi:NAD dependent epimerase/dehydratase family enzyme
LSKALAKTLKRPFIAPAVPAFALKLALGEMAAIALMSQKTSELKTHALGFEYHFKTIDAALNDLYR